MVKHGHALEFGIGLEQAARGVEQAEVFDIPAAGEPAALEFPGFVRGQGGNDRQGGRPEENGENDSRAKMVFHEAPPFSTHPILDLEAGDAAEFADIVGDEDRA